MKPTEILKTMLDGKLVKLKEEAFARYLKDEEELPENKFTIFQIEQTVVNLHNASVEAVSHDHPFDDIELLQVNL